MPSVEGTTITSRTGLTVIYGLKKVQVRIKADPAQPDLPAFANAQAIVIGGEAITMSADTFDAEGLGRIALTNQSTLGAGVALFLRDADGRLVASGLQPASATGSEVPVTVVKNAAVAAVTRSLDDNNVADGVVIRATPLEMSSGYVDNLPGVDHVDIEVSGPAYGDGHEVAKLGVLRAPDLATYQWQPSVASGTYSPDKLAEPGTPLPFYLTTRAFDPQGHEVGVTTVKIAIVGTATITIGVDEHSK
jgi:hypothetical protein